MQSSLSSLDKSWLRINFLKISLSFNLLLLSRTLFLVLWLSNFTSLGFEAFSNFLSFLDISTISASVCLVSDFFQEVWHKFFVFRLGIARNCKIWCYSVSSAFHCLFPPLFLFLALSPASFQHPWWGCPLYFKTDHCLVSNLFSSSFWIETLFTSFRFSWSSSTCFPCSLIVSTNLLVDLIIILSSLTS